MKQFVIVAGEASGDMYGADVARALKRRFEGARIFGLGGDRMREAGVELVADISNTAVVGPFEAVGYFGTLYRVFRKIVDRIESTPPEAAILIDFPDFNLRLAGRIKAAGVPIVYYISPQVWAWRAGRVRQIRDLVDKMLVILPFEEDIYRRAGVEVEFVGHPLLDMVRPRMSKSVFLTKYRLEARKPVVAILPGSRKKELRFVLPTLCLATDLILQKKPETQFVLPVASGLDAEGGRVREERLQGRHRAHARPDEPGELSLLDRRVARVHPEAGSHPAADTAVRAGAGLAARGPLQDQLRGPP